MKWHLYWHVYENYSVCKCNHRHNGRSSSIYLKYKDLVKGGFDFYKIYTAQYLILTDFQWIVVGSSNLMRVHLVSIPIILLIPIWTTYRNEYYFIYEIFQIVVSRSQVSRNTKKRTKNKLKKLSKWINRESLNQHIIGSFSCPFSWNSKDT